MKRIAVLTSHIRHFVSFGEGLPDAIINVSQRRIEWGDKEYIRVTNWDEIYGIEWDDILRIGDWYNTPHSGELEREVLARIGRNK